MTTPSASVSVFELSRITWWRSLATDERIGSIRFFLSSMTAFIDAGGFRANVGIVLMRDDRQVFLGGRTGGRGWQFPQGGVQQRETPEEALYRELKEEVGLDPHDVKLIAGTR